MPASLRKILLTTPYDLAVDGGVNSQLWGLYRALKQTGYQVKVVGPSSAPGRHLCEDLTVAGKVVSWRLNQAVSNVTPDIRIRARIKALMQNFQPDIVHLQEPLLPILNTLVLYYSRTVNVGTYHTYSETSRGYDLARPILKWHHNRVHVHIAVSRAARRFVAKTFPGTYTLIPNGVDPPVSTVTANPDNQPIDRKIRLLFVGRLSEPRKGFPVLLAAMDILEKGWPDRFHLTVAGGSPAKTLPALRCQNITWLGRLSRADLDAAYAACDLVCAPSLGGESFGLVLLEAFAFGKPVVASDIAGYREMAGDAGCAALVEPGSSRALARGITNVVAAADTYRAMCGAARRHARRFAWSTVVDRILACYETAHARQTSNKRPDGALR